MKKNFAPNPKSLKNTFCVFNEVSSSFIENAEPNYSSNSGSKYYYTKEGMYRLSNHWGRLANSKWRLIPLDIETTKKLKLGFAKWDAFYPDNKWEELYYLEVNFEAKTVTYQHKNNPLYNQKTLLRTADATTKRIKQIRNLFELTNWANHFEEENIDYLRKLIITPLIETNTPLEQIKRDVFQHLSLGNL